MKILQVNCVYNKGSTGKIMYEVHTFLASHGCASVVCYGRGKRVIESGVYKTCSELYAKFNNLFSKFTGLMYGGNFFSTARLVARIKKENPDLVHLHCINGYFVNIYKLVSWLKESGIPTVLTLHAEFMHTANCAHALECDKWKTGCGNCPRLRKETGSLFFDRTHTSWERMKKAFENFQNLTVVSVSPWLMERAKQSPILSDKEHKVVLNGLDTEIFTLRETDVLKKELGIADEKIVFHATPYFTDDETHLKGGHYVLKLAELMPDVKFVVAGKYDPEIKVPQNVLLLGNVSDMNKLSALYSLADATVIASRKETFSMIVAESLCCGTKVFGFKAGAPEQITIPEYSEFLDYGDVDGLYEALKKSLASSYDKREVSEKAKEKYSNKRMCSQYFEIYKNGTKKTER